MEHVILKRIEDWDWEEAFKYADPKEYTYGGFDFEPGISKASFGQEDVEYIEAAIDGENDEEDWVLVGKLRDGRWFSLRAGCDYTGWGWQEWGSCAVGSTLEIILKFGVDPEEKKRLGLE